MASDPSGNDPFTGMGSTTPPRGVESEKEEEVAGKEEEAVEPQIVEDPRLYQFSCGEEGDDQLIMQAIMTGNLSSVIDLCQRTDKWADALLFAQLSPQNDLFEQVSTWSLWEWWCHSSCYYYNSSSFFLFILTSPPPFLPNKLIKG